MGDNSVGDNSVGTLDNGDVADVSEQCNQRRQNMLFNVPPIRFTPTNPYASSLHFTQDQLNMRRKVEILKYNQSSSQGNKPTKKEQWAHMNSRKYSVRKVIGNASLLPGANVVSSIDCATIPTSSKQSNIPGPAITLQLDHSVPLYNYGAPVRTYAFLNDENSDAFQVIPNGNEKIFYHETQGFFTNLKILDAIDESAKLFTMTIPFSLGYSKLVGVSESTDISGQIFVETPLFGSNIATIYYNSVATNSGNHTFLMDVSGHTFLSSTESTVEQLNVGTITIRDVYIQTQPGYFYEIAHRFQLGTTMSLDEVSPYLKVDMSQVKFSTN